MSPQVQFDKNEAPSVQFNHEMVGDSVTSGETTVVPVARATGQYWFAPDGAWAGGRARLRPDVIRVSQADGSLQEIPILGSQDQALKGMLMGAGAVAALCSMLVVVTQLLTFWKTRTR